MPEQMIQRIIERILRIIKLDTKVYPEIAHDERATTEAATVVVVAALFAAIGNAVGAHSIGRFFGSLITGVLISWLLWSYVTMFIGTRLFQGQATFWEMARTLGYANAPMILGILAVFGCVGGVIGIVAAVLSLIAGFFAVRETLELTTEKAIITILVGWVILIVVSLIVNMVF